MWFVRLVVSLMIEVQSSAIRAVGYAGTTLTIEFCNGRLYDFPGVPYELFLGLLQAPSKGSFYNQFIRGKFK